MFSFFKKKEYKLTPIQELLLALLRAQLWLKPVDDIVLPSSLDEWDELINLGYKQTVICFIAKACLRHPDASNIPLDIKEEFAAVLEENKRIHEYHNSVLVELITKFEEQGLHPILLKGQGIAQMYPEPELRQCGDIDLYFRPYEYEKAKSYIQSIEDCIEKRQKEKHHHFESKYNGIIVEIHRYTNNFNNPFVDKRYKEWTIEQTNHTEEIQVCSCLARIFPPLYNILMIFTHMCHHMEKGGTNLRQLSDVLMSINHFSMINRDDIISKIKSLGLVDYWNIMLFLFVKYIGMDSYNCLLKSNDIEMKAHYVLYNVLRFGAFNYISKDEIIGCSSSFLFKKISYHIYGFREAKRIYFLSPNSAFWYYSKFKNNFIYRVCLIFSK